MLNETHFEMKQGLIRVLIKPLIVIQYA